MAKLLPFEKDILSSLCAAISPELRDQYSAQVESINKVQRLLDWKEIEFYCMRWFKVRWPREVLFRNQAEFVLGSGTFSVALLHLLMSGQSADISSQ